MFVGYSELIMNTKLVATIKYNEEGLIIDIWKGDELVDTMTIWEMDYEQARRNDVESRYTDARAITTV